MYVCLWDRELVETGCSCVRIGTCLFVTVCVCVMSGCVRVFMYSCVSVCMCDPCVRLCVSVCVCANALVSVCVLV